MVIFFSQLIERVSFDLFMTVNGTLNPASFIRKYYIEDNFNEFVKAIREIRKNVIILSDLVNETMANSTTDQGCLFELRHNLKSIRENPFIGSHDITITQIRELIEKHAYYLGMYRPFAM
jgi:hypothetical protein